MPKQNKPHTTIDAKLLIELPLPGMLKYKTSINLVLTTILLCCWSLSNLAIGQGSLLGCSIGIEAAESKNFQITPETFDYSSPIRYNINARLGNVSLHLAKNIEVQLGGFQLSTFYSDPLCNNGECSNKVHLLYGFAPLGIQYHKKRISTGLFFQHHTSFGWNYYGWKNQYPTARRSASTVEGCISLSVPTSRTKPNKLIVSAGYRLSNSLDILSKRERVSPTGANVIYGGRYKPLSSGVYLACNLIIRQQQKETITLNSQSKKVKSKSRSPKHKKSQLAPLIPIIQMSIKKFIDGNKNQSIDGLEQGAVFLLLENSGNGSCQNCEIQLSLKGNTKGISVDKTLAVPNIQPGKKITLEIPYSADRTVREGEATFLIEFIEPNGFAPLPIEYTVQTKPFQSPMIEVVDFELSPTRMEPNQVANLRIQIQNTGIGDAEDIDIQASIPANVTCMTSNLDENIKTLTSGSTMEIEYVLIAPRAFEYKQIEIAIEITEKHGDYGSTWKERIPFDNDSDEFNRVSQKAAATDDRNEVTRASLERANNAPSEVTFERTGKEHSITAVAVIPKMIEGCDGNSKSADALASFTETKILSHYEVIDRRHFEDILNEQRIQMSGLTFEETLIEKGCIENAQGYLFVGSECLFGDEMITVKLTHCESSEVVWSCTGINATAQKILDKVREELEKE
jgi:hypothetical protein